MRTTKATVVLVASIVSFAWGKWQSLHCILSGFGEKIIISRLAFIFFSGRIAHIQKGTI